MKKITALLLALVLLVSLVSCGKIAEVAEKIGEEIKESSDGETATKKFSPGTVDGNTYKSEYLGIGVTLDESWVFATEDEIRQLNEQVISSLGDIFGDDYEKALEQAPYATEMYAMNNTDYGVIEINIENDGFRGLTMSVEDYMDIADEQLKEAYDGLGVENLVIVRESFEFAGKTQMAFHMNGDYMGLSLESISVIIKNGPRFATVAITSYTDSAEEIAAQFFAVE